MSLYHDAVTVLSNETNAGGSFKSRLYNAQNLRSSPSKLYALIVETAKWDIVLKEVIENAGILDVDNKVFPTYRSIYATPISCAAKNQRTKG